MRNVLFNKINIKNQTTNICHKHIFSYYTHLYLQRGTILQNTFKLIKI